jgi:lysyl-tRNA synthetase class 2
MFHVLKNKEIRENIPWQPSASREMLTIRATLLQKIREFFAARHILEVETPLLCSASVTDPYIQSISVLAHDHPPYYYLQTSPEYAMKRLLAAGSGPIYQISKAFRRGEVGHIHNPEFSMLEWYRLDYDHHDLMNEMDAFLQAAIQALPAERKTYAELFQHFLNIDPHFATIADLAACAAQQHISLASTNFDRDGWLDILLTHCIEPQLGTERPFFIYDFPASQAALARIVSGHPPTASRFEVYYKGMELANGFHELQNATEQRRRFEKNCAAREKLNLAAIPIDEYFLHALSHGLPNCAGVALGIDRLLFAATAAKHIREVISFDWERV